MHAPPRIALSSPPKALSPLLLIALLSAQASATTPKKTAQTPRKAAKAIPTVGSEKIRPPQDSSQIIATAIAKRKAGDFKGAFALLQGLIEANARDARGHHELGVLYALHGQLKKAINHLRVATLLNPTAASSRLNLAELLRANGDHDDALREYRQIIESPQMRPKVLRGVALCQEALGQNQEALKTLKTLTRDHGETRPGGWAKTHLSWLQQQESRGEVSPTAADSEGRRLFREGRYDLASEWFRFALRTAPSADRAYRLAIALLSGRDYLGAVANLQRALHLEPGHRAARSAWPTAIRKLRVAGVGGLTVEMAPPHDGPPMRRVARALREGDLLLAIQMAAAGLRGPYKGVVLELQYAEALLRDGRLGSAEKALRRVLRSRPHHPQAIAALAEIAWRRGRFAQARQLAKLPAPAAGPEGAKASSRRANDLRQFIQWRRASFDRAMGMLLDPGLRPQPAFQRVDGPCPESLRSNRLSPEEAKRIPQPS